MKKPTSMQRVPTRLRPPGPESPADLVRARTEAMNAHSAPRAWPEWVLPCVREVPTTSGVYAVFDRDTGMYYYGSTATQVKRRGRACDGRRPPPPWGEVAQLDLSTPLRKFLLKLRQNCRSFTPNDTQMPPQSHLQFPAHHT